MTIHTSHPFADPDPDPARRLRGRLGNTVTLWTTGQGPGRAGLTISSTMIALGETPRVLALLDPDSDFRDAFEDSGRAVVQLLRWEHRQLAEAFAGTAPAPGGAFRQGEFVDTEHGPRLVDADAWAAVSLADQREVGWSVEVTATLDDVAVGDEDDEPLLHRRGRFFTPPMA
ncbi:flavin reductase family protein [Nocardioides panacisoli]|uniref:flavin reductase family protein n=1 Tax=Nocardioides panacisoli TaxID=627624 RepID=UPI001C639634|nr:flavin reductase family protein [Nocardioides panacisoli]QYJ04672.1 flavin reductase family protein [Nocardioides panacisoli]